MPKIPELPALASPAPADSLVVTDADAADAVKRITVAALLSLAYPVGSVYFGTTSTNPAASLGFGTWEAFGAGRVPVGFDATQTEFDADEETGGVKEVTLTGAQSGLPQHTHLQSPHTHVQDAHTHLQNAHTHTQSVNSATTGGLSGYTPDTSSNTSVTSGYSTGSTTAVNQNSTAVNQSTTAVNQNAGPVDAAQAHANLQPYVVVRMWKRTA